MYNVQLKETNENENTSVYLGSNDEKNVTNDQFSLQSNSTQKKLLKISMKPKKRLRLVQKRISFIVEFEINIRDTNFCRKFQRDKQKIEP